MHSTFGSSKLVRLLDPWTPVATETGSADIAERLSGWFGPLEAIRLQALNQSLSAAPESSRKQSAFSAQALAEDVQRVRGALAKAIAQDPLLAAGVRPDDPDRGYAPWHQRHLELQRQMAQMVEAVRDHVRNVIARVSPRLHRLATLDAGMQDLLAAREESLLPGTAALLERRYHQLKGAHRQACEALGQPDDPSHWLEAGGWLAHFANDWRQALLAEVDLRLEPVCGLVDAMRNESETPTT